MLQLAKILLIVTILYNVAEGIVAIWSGIVAGSIALVAFGADSYLEVAAASLVLWRVGIRDEEYAERIEGRVVRFHWVDFHHPVGGHSLPVGVGAG